MPQAAEADLVNLALRRIPGGVSTNIRIAEGPQKLIVNRSSGCRVFTIDGRELIDYVCGYGSVLLGYANPHLVDVQIEALRQGVGFNATNPWEVEVADQIATLFPGENMVRLCATGSEATTAAINLARAETARQDIAVFRDHYHGWHGPTVGARVPVPGDIPTRSSSASVFELPFRDVATCEAFLREHGSRLACVIFELISPSEGRDPEAALVQLLHRERERHGFLLIADEVVTGFRVGLRGAQQQFALRPDLTVFGKALGGSIPIGAVLGTSDYMQLFATGKAVHAGTFNGHALAAASASAMVKYLKANEHTVYPQLKRNGQRLCAELNAAAKEVGADCEARGPGPFFAFGPRENGPARAQWLLRFWEELLARGVRIPQGGRWFLGTAHTDADIDRTITAAREALRAM